MSKLKGNKTLIKKSRKKNQKKKDHSTNTKNKEVQFANFIG